MQADEEASCRRVCESHSRKCERSGEKEEEREERSWFSAVGHHWQEKEGLIPLEKLLPAAVKLELQRISYERTQKM